MYGVVGLSLETYDKINSMEELLMLDINKQAPNFSLKNHDGKEVMLSDYLGRKVVLYFYPADFTPGCTEQACAYRDQSEDFFEHKTVVLGISQDSVDSHAKFNDEYGLTFDVLSDPDHEAINAYGVWGEKVRDGVSKMGVIRTTFILNENHEIVEIFKDTDPKTDATRVLEALNHIKVPIQRYYVLNNNVVVDSIGFGTWQIPDGQQTYDSVRWALEHGYRHIDTAYVYRNEKSVGQAIRDSGIDRKEIFVTTKLSANIKDPSLVEKYFEKSLNNLGMDYVDMYLIHNARPWSDAIPNYDYFDENVAVWQEMEKIYDSGRARSIGVSNFNEKDLENLLARTMTIPVMNQIKYHPGHLQISVTEFCDNHNILVEAYSPFATGKIFGSPEIKAIAEKHGRTEAQIIMAWILRKGYLPLPKSTHEERIKSNREVFDIKLSDEDMDILTQHPEITK